MDAVVEKLRRRVAIAVEHTAEEKHEIAGQHLIQPAMQYEQRSQREQRPGSMREIGRPIGSAAYEFRSRHAEEGKHEIGLWGKRAWHEPDDRTRAPHPSGYTVPDRGGL